MPPAEARSVSELRDSKLQRWAGLGAQRRRRAGPPRSRTVVCCRAENFVRKYNRALLEKLALADEKARLQQEHEVWRLACPLERR